MTNARIPIKKSVVMIPSDDRIYKENLWSWQKDALINNLQKTR